MATRRKASGSTAALPVSQAQDRILHGVKTLQSLSVPLEEAYGRVLAEPLCAKLTQPPFPASAMDGYGVRAVDVSTLPARLKVIGASAAGHGFEGVVQSGEAVRIFTGAPVPEGADAIVIQENVCPSSDGADVVTIKEGKPNSSHIRPRGGDFSKGDVLLEAGVTLMARHLTLAAAMGHGSLPVRRAPVVAILSTGDELVAPGVVPGPHQIVASNAHGIAGIVRSAGGTAQLLGIASDTRESLETKIKSASQADVLVTIGGASVGEHDLVGPVLRDLGMTLDFWKIAMRPGKPLLFGRLNNLRILGVPGNPVSSLICARVFLVPLLRVLLGVTPAVDPGPMRAKLLVPLPENGPREHYMRAKFSNGGDDLGLKAVAPLPDQDSSLMVPLVRADCLIVRPPLAPEAPIGENVTVIPLDF